MESIHATAPETLPPAQLKRRGRILQAAAEQLVENGYEAVQIRDIASAAGVALGTLYRYFSSKEHIYAAVMAEWSSPFFRLPPDLEVGVEPLQRFRFRLRRVVAAFTKNPAFVTVMMMLNMSTDSNVMALRAELGRELNTELQKDLSFLPPQRAADITTLGWCVTTQLVTNRSAVGTSLDDAFRVLDEFVALIERGTAPN